MVRKLTEDSLQSFYKNKRILITGHTGFKGSWLTYILLKLGANIVGYSDTIPTHPSLFECLQLKKEINHNFGDIRDIENLKKVVSGAKPELCFHLAAQPLVRISYQEPLLTYTTNINGSINMLETIRLSDSIRTLLMITSDKCYENKEWDYGYRESDCMGGHDPYSSSKACCELIVNAYRTSYLEQQGIGCATVRAGNVIGGGDWSLDRLVVDVVNSLSQNQSVKIRYPKATRPWQHVLDPLFGYLILAFKLHSEPKLFQGGWNFGPTGTQNLTVEEIVQKMISIWGSGSYEISSEATSHEAGKLALDIHKAISLLPWQPCWGTEKAIEQTIIWYKTFYEESSKKLQELTEDQLNSYLIDFGLCSV